MPVLKDYKCPSHGYFESFEAKCKKKGCKEELEVIFLQAPAMISDATKRNDRTLNNLSKDYNMTNIKSTKEGENQSGNFSHAKNKPDQKKGQGVIWGGSKFQQSSPWAGVNMKSVMGGNSYKSVAGEDVGCALTFSKKLTNPGVKSYIQDHEGLKIKK